MWRVHNQIHKAGQWNSWALNYTVPCPVSIQLTVESASLHRLRSNIDCCHVVWQKVLFSKDHIKTVFGELTAGFGTFFFSWMFFNTKHFNKQHLCFICLFVYVLHRGNMQFNEAVRIFLVLFFHNRLNASQIFMSSVSTSGKVHASNITVWRVIRRKYYLFRGTMPVSGTAL